MGRGHLYSVYFCPRCLAANRQFELEPGGFLALEVGAGQAGLARRDMIRSGFRNLRIQNDLSGIGRVVVGHRRS